MSTRVAIARFMMDIILADHGVIEKDELDAFNRICGEFGIMGRDIESARYYTLGDAINHIIREFKDETETLKEYLGLKPDKTLPISLAVQMLKKRPATKKGITLTKILCKAYDLTLADKKSKVEEGIIAIALYYCVFRTCDFFSTDLGYAEMDDRTVIYIEDERIAWGEHFVEEQRLISNELKLLDMHLIYIPDISKKFDPNKLENRKFFEDLLNFLDPLGAKKDILKIQTSLCNISTHAFCRNKLYSKLNMPVLNVFPSLLIKIGESQVKRADGSYVRMSNFFRLEFERGKDIQGNDTYSTPMYRQVEWFCKDLRRFVSTVVLKREHADDKFIFAGFSRTFYLMCVNEYSDIVSAPITFMPYCCSVKIGDVVIPLKPKGFVIYMMICYYYAKNISSGLPSTAPADAEEVKKYEETYRNFYGMLPDDCQNSRNSLHVFGSGLRQTKDAVNRKLRDAAVEHNIKNIEFYCVELKERYSKNNYHVLKLNKDLIMYQKREKASAEELLLL